jgi:GTP-binding protein
VKIRSAEFVTSVGPTTTEIPSDLPQIAFSGRSNVGKSSLINTLLRRTRNKLAHVSGRPGKTQTINFFRVNDRFYLVDLPGFGFAKVPKKLQDEWRTLIEGYLERDDGPRGIVHLLDMRRGATDLDLQMLDYLAGLGLPTLVVLTKSDKLGTQQRRKTVEQVLKRLGLDREQVLPFSSKNGDGRDELLAALEGLIEESESA